MVGSFKKLNAALIIVEIRFKAKILLSLFFADEIFFHAI